MHLGYLLSELLFSSASCRCWVCIKGLGWFWVSPFPALYKGESDDWHPLHLQDRRQPCFRMSKGAESSATTFYWKGAIVAWVSITCLFDWRQTYDTITQCNGWLTLLFTPWMMMSSSCFMGTCSAGWQDLTTWCSYAKDWVLQTWACGDGWKRCAACICTRA